MSTIRRVRVVGCLFWGVGGGGVSNIFAASVYGVAADRVVALWEVNCGIKMGMFLGLL